MWKIKKKKLNAYKFNVPPCLNNDLMVWEGSYLTLSLPRLRKIYERRWQKLFIAVLIIHKSIYTRHTNIYIPNTMFHYAFHVYQICWYVWLMRYLQSHMHKHMHIHIHTQRSRLHCIIQLYKTREMCIFILYCHCCC